MKQTYYVSKAQMIAFLRKFGHKARHIRDLKVKKLKEMFDAEVRKGLGVPPKQD